MKIHMTDEQRRRHDRSYREYLIARGLIAPGAGFPAYWTVCDTVPSWLIDMVRRGEA